MKGMEINKDFEAAFEPSATTATTAADWEQRLAARQRVLIKMLDNLNSLETMREQSNALMLATMDELPDEVQQIFNRFLYSLDSASGGAANLYLEIRELIDRAED